MIKTFQTDSQGAFIEKDPGSTLDYSFDWTAWLATSAGDAIASSTWTNPGLTAGVATFAAGVTTVYLSGGVAGIIYTVTNTIVTTGGRTEKRSFRIIGKTQ